MLFKFYEQRMGKHSSSVAVKVFVGEDETNMSPSGELRMSKGEWRKFKLLLVGPRPSINYPEILFSGGTEARNAPRDKGDNSS